MASFTRDLAYCEGMDDVSFGLEEESFGFGGGVMMPSALQGNS